MMGDSVYLNVTLFFGQSKIKQATTSVHNRCVFIFSYFCLGLVVFPEYLASGGLKTLNSNWWQLII